MENLVFSDITAALGLLLTLCLGIAAFLIAKRALHSYTDFSEEFDRIDTAISNATDAEIDAYFMDMAWKEAIRENEYTSEERREKSC